MKRKMMKEIRKKEIDKMNTINPLKILSLLAFLLICIPLVMAQTVDSSYNVVNTLPFYGDASIIPTFTEEMCGKGTDFLVEIMPGSCSPMVVRSDLLEEQTVPIYCKLTGIKINPLIEIPTIRNIQLERKNSTKGIENIIFYPARKGLQTPFSQFLGSPRESNLGYLIVFLKQIINENNMPDFVAANLSARIDYDIKKSLGIEEDQLLLPVLSEEEWKSSYETYGFWHGRGFVRATEIRDNDAQIQVYSSENTPLITNRIKIDGESDMNFLPGFYCSASYKIKLDDIVDPQVTADLNVNGNTVKVAKGDKIRGTTCTAGSIEVSPYGIGGEIEITGCGQGTYTLKREVVPSAILNISGVSKEYKIGEEVNITANNKNFILGFASKTFIKGEDEPSDIAIIFERKEGFSAEDFKKKTLSSFKSIFSRILGKQTTLDLTRSNLEDSINKLYEDDLKGKMIIHYVYNEESEIELKDKTKVKIKIESIRGLQNNKSDSITEEFYAKAIDAYRDVVSEHLDLKEIETNSSIKVYYGEKALLEAIHKARELEKFLDEAKLLKEFITKYPSSGFIKDTKKRLNDLYLISNPEKASTLIEGDSEVYSISLEEINEPSIFEKSVELQIDGSMITDKYMEGDFVGEGNWSVYEIKENKVTFKNIHTEAKEDIAINKEVALGTEKVGVYKINYKKFAKVTIMPNAKDRVSYANFTFRVGIEKRAINLSPEQTKDLIKEVDNKIKDFENINSNLNKTVTNWKKACLIGAGVLWINSFFDNLGGRARARQEVMRGVGGKKGIIDECESLVLQNKEEWKSVSNCLYKRNDEIEKQVNLVEEANKLVNKETFNKNLTQLQDILKDPATMGIYKKSYEGLNFTKTGGGQEKLSNALNTLNNAQRLQYKGDAIDIYEQMNLVKQCQDKKTDPAINNSVLCRNAKDSLGKELERQNQLFLDDEQSKNAMGQHGAFFYVNHNDKDKSICSAILELATTRNALAEKYKIDSTGTAAVSAAFFGLSSTGHNYVAIVSNPAGQTYTIQELYDINKTPVKRLTESEISALKISYSINTVNPSELCKGVYTGEKVVRFWETGKYVGMPALMPIDITNGYYFATKAAGTGIEAYTESGLLNNFYICNVGPDGKPDFDFGTGAIPESKDCCIECSYGTMGQQCGGVVAGLSTTQNTKLISVAGIQQRTNELFNSLGITDSRTNDLAKQAEECSRQAAQLYREQKKNIATKCCPECGHGAPAIETPSVACEDFMSPSSCTMLYNLCDPVICPSSRCDAAGRYHVADVIQTGVIGGIFLCLHNFPQVIVPVCLSGIHAGFENIISILKSSKQCLEENLATGRKIGICDEITSVYWCELFWREISPFIELALPDIMASIVVGGRKGGEYANFMDAWTSAGKSMDYFSTFYAKNAYAAFQIRSTAQIGTEVCKGFVSIAYPDSAELLEEWAKPESPYQINAWFSEEPFTTATVPSTSAYHVYAHIYAGEDSGRYYSVYLKQPPAPGYYQTPETWPIPGMQMVYLNKGDSVDVKKDFTAPGNYVELCIRIDATEHCGFKKATTTFGVDELAALYTKEIAAQEDITTEKDCVSGKSTLLPLLTTTLTELNIEEAVKESIEPEIWRRGIIRICATQNPGTGTNTERWTPIGYCDRNKNMKCWLDEDSVKGAIKDTKLQDMARQDAENLSYKILLTEGYLSEDESNKTLAEIRENITRVLPEIKSGMSINNINIKIKDIVDTLNWVAERSISPYHRAQARMEKALLYNNITITIRTTPVVTQPPPSSTGGGEQPIITGECPGKKWEAEINKSIKDLKDFKISEITEGFNTAYLIEALISYESSGNEKEVSDCGAAGLMQLMPQAAKDRGLKVFEDNGFYACQENNQIKADVKSYVEKLRATARTSSIDQRFDPSLNIKAGIQHLFSMSGVTIKQKLSNYLGTGKSDPLGTTGSGYVQSILSIYPKCAKASMPKTEVSPVSAEAIKNCKLSNARWSVTEAADGQEIKLYVDGLNCEDLGVTFKIYEVSGLTRTLLLLKSDEIPQSSLFPQLKKSGVAETKWKVKWVKDEGIFIIGALNSNAEYKFDACVGSKCETSGKLTVKRPETAVAAAAAVKNCIISSARWSVTEAADKQEIKLYVDGTGCGNADMTFRIYEVSGLTKTPYSILSFTPTKNFSASKKSDVAYMDWLAIWMEDKGIPIIGALNSNAEYKFEVCVGAGSKCITSTKLTVKKPETAVAAAAAVKNCVLSSARWSVTQAADGQEIKLYVDGTSCGDADLTFKIYEVSGLTRTPYSILSFTPTKNFSASKKSDVAYMDWLAIWMEDKGIPILGALDSNAEYKFDACVGSKCITSNKLTVKKPETAAAPKEITIRAAVETTVATLHPIMFEFDKSVATTAYLNSLRAEIAALKDKITDSDHIVINGYASIEGDANYNQLLSQKRADSVKTIVLSALLGLNIKDIEVVAEGKGENSSFSERRYGNNAKIESARISAISDSAERKLEAAKSTILAEDRRVTIEVKESTAGETTEITISSEFLTQNQETQNQLALYRAVPFDQVTSSCDIPEEKISKIENLIEGASSVSIATESLAPLKEAVTRSDEINVCGITPSQIQQVTDLKTQAENLIKQNLQNSIEEQRATIKQSKISTSITPYTSKITQTTPFVLEVSTSTFSLKELVDVEAGLRKAAEEIKTGKANTETVLPAGVYSVEARNAEQEQQKKDLYKQNIKIIIDKLKEKGCGAESENLKDALDNSKTASDYEKTSKKAELLYTACTKVFDDIVPPVSEKKVSVGQKCESVSENEDLEKSSGRYYSCYASGDCRSDMTKGQMDCGTGKQCCRPKCETAFSGYQCTDLKVDTCVSNAKRYYCSGPVTTICCEKGKTRTEVTASQLNNELIPSGLNRVDVLLVTTSKLLIDSDFISALEEYRKAVESEGLSTGFIILDNERYNAYTNVNNIAKNWNNWQYISGVFSNVIAKTKPKYMIILGGDDVIPVPYRADRCEYSNCSASELSALMGYNTTYTRSYDGRFISDDFYNLKEKNVALARFPTVKGDTTSTLVTKVLRTNAENRQPIDFNDMHIISDGCGHKGECFIKDSTDVLSKMLFGTDCQSSEKCSFAPPKCPACKEKSSYFNILNDNEVIIINSHNRYPWRYLLVNDINGVSKILLDTKDFDYINFETKNPLVILAGCHTAALDITEAECLKRSAIIKKTGYLNQYPVTGRPEGCNKPSEYSLEKGARIIIGTSRISSSTFDELVIERMITNLKKEKEARIGDLWLEMKKADTTDDEDVLIAQLFGDPTQKVRI